MADLPRIAEFEALLDQERAENRQLRTELRRLREENRNLSDAMSEMETIRPPRS